MWSDPFESPSWNRETVLGAVWTSDDELLTCSYLPNAFMNTTYFETWRRNGARIFATSVPLPAYWNGEPDPGFGCVNLHVVDRSTLVVDTQREMSDGYHFWVSVVDLRASRLAPLHEGGFLGVSPDRQWVAVGPLDWVGPYKRGGERVGPV